MPWPARLGRQLVAEQVTQSAEGSVVGSQLNFSFRCEHAPPQSAVLITFRHLLYPVRNHGFQSF